MAINSASLNSVFHALADPTRRAVLLQLGEGRASIKELAEYVETLASEKKAK